MKDRHMELSSKFIEMGRALLKEGEESNDYSITQIGSVMILIGGLMFDDEDVYEFSSLCSMFSAKKLLENMENNNHDFIRYIKEKAESESYDDFIKKINKIRTKKRKKPPTD
jgi:hypothetical protein